MSHWYKNTTLGDECCFDTHCPDCEENGSCDSCDTIDGRYCDAVAEYASTCDYCYELVHNELQHMNPKSQLAYCNRCLPIALKLGLINESDI